MLIGLNYIRPMVETELSEYIEVLDILRYFPIIFIAGGLLSFSVYFWKEKKLRAFLTYTAVAYIALIVIITMVLPLVDEFKPAKTLAEALPDQLENEVRVVSSLEMEPASLVFYSKTKVLYIRDVNKLEEYLQNNESVYAYLDREDYNKIKDSFAELQIVKEYKDMLVIKNFKGDQ